MDLADEPLIPITQSEWSDAYFEGHKVTEAECERSALAKINNSYSYAGSRSEELEERRSGQSRRELKVCMMTASERHPTEMARQRLAGANGNMARRCHCASKKVLCACPRDQKASATRLRKCFSYWKFIRGSEAHH